MESRRVHDDTDPQPAIEAMDHVNIVTRNVAEMEAFYRDVVGLHVGSRPGFQSSGRWMYAAERPVVHLVEGAKARRPASPQIEHFALRATGLRQFADRLRASGIDYRFAIVPDIDLRILNLADYDGNRIELVFAATEPLPAHLAG